MGTYSLHWSECWIVSTHLYQCFVNVPLHGEFQTTCLNQFSSISVTSFFMIGITLLWQSNAVLFCHSWSGQQSDICHTWSSLLFNRIFIKLLSWRIHCGLGYFSLHGTCPAFHCWSRTRWYSLLKSTPRLCWRLNAAMTGGIIFSWQDADEEKWVKPHDHPTRSKLQDVMEALQPHLEQQDTNMRRAIPVFKHILSGGKKAYWTNT